MTRPVIDPHTLAPVRETPRQEADRLTSEYHRQWKALKQDLIAKQAIAEESRVLTEVRSAARRGEKSMMTTMTLPIGFAGPDNVKEEFLTELAKVVMNRLKEGGFDAYIRSSTSPTGVHVRWGAV